MENSKKKPPYMRSATSLILLVLVFVLIFTFFYNKGDGGQYISMAGAGTEEVTTVERLVSEEKVKSIYVINGVGYILLHDSKLTTKDFPKYADYNFSYTSYNSLAEIFKDEFGATKSGIESYVEANKAQSFLAMILPFLPVVIMVVMLFLLFKMLSGKGGANSFAKIKARSVEKSNIKFEDIAGADEEKEEIRELVEFLKNPAKFNNLGARIPKGALLVGPPGTGKTLLAKAVAGESNVPFFSISGSDFVELYVGLGASRVRDLFTTAKKNAPCIIFIDEIDAVGRQRGAGLGGGNDEREQTLNQLLVEMDGFENNEGIVVMAATNRADVLDPALLRPGRFDRQVFVHFPDVKGREGIIKIHAKNKPLDSEIDFKTIARLTSGFTGADIENLLNEAAIMAARDDRVTINMDDITEGIYKVQMGPQRKSRVVTENDRKIVAYHEAGHAIVAKTLKQGEVQEVSIIPRGSAGGYTATRKTNDDDHLSLSRLNAEISILMGGRVAEEIIFKDDITAGASSDIKRATEIAYKMVTEWGMSKKLGFINFGKGDEVFIGRDYQMQTSYSDATAKLIDEEVKLIIDTIYANTKKIMEDNRDKLESMAKLLLEKETIYEAEVDAIMQGKDYIEVAEELTVKIEQKRERDEKAKLKQKLATEEKMQELKVQTAEVFKNVGVITESEFEMIKKETEDLKEKNKQIIVEKNLEPDKKAVEQDTNKEMKVDTTNSATTKKETKTTAGEKEKTIANKSDKKPATKNAKTTEAKKKTSETTTKKDTHKKD